VYIIKKGVTGKELTKAALVKHDDKSIRGGNVLVGGFGREEAGPVHI